jgi:hypothetical protein
MNPGRVRNVSILQDIQTCCGTQQASSLISTEAGVKQLGCEADHAPPSSAEVKNMSTALICLQTV